MDDKTIVEYSVWVLNIANNLFALDENIIEPKLVRKV